jgi:DNA-binding NarL/FixJ family response regulator
VIGEMSDLAVASDPIRILIAEDQQFVADALQALLSQQPGMVVVGNVDSVVASLPSVVTLQPDVVILEFRMTNENAAAVRTIQEDSTARVILLTRDETENVIAAAIEVGASAVLNLSTAAVEVIHAVRTVADGGSLIAPRTIASVLQRRRSTDGMRDRLTTRERQVVTLMSEGASNREIAARMGISYTTVRSHLRNVASKLAVHSKLEVLVTAQRLQLLDKKTAARISFA